MRSDRLWVIASSFSFALGCGSADGTPSGAAGLGGNASGGSAGASPAGAGGSPRGGSGGAALTGGVAGAHSSGGTTGGRANGGTGGRPNGSAGTSMSGGSLSGGTSGAPSGGGFGRGGRGSGGRGAGAPSTGGTNQNAGAGSGGTPSTGGTGGCVQNLACTLQAPPSSGDIHQDCVDRINQFRTECACLPPLTRRTDGEACADQMAEYDAGKGKAHAGVSDEICTPGGAQNECPGYDSERQTISLCLQQMWDEGPPPTDPCEGTCFQEYGHFINMTSTSTTRVACGFFTTSSGKVWAVQNFTR